MTGSAAGEGTISRSMRIGSSATITCDRAMPKEPRISHICDGGPGSAQVGWNRNRMFRSADDGLAWAERHLVTGILTEYAVGDGCYDIAVAEGMFTPKRPHHGTPNHVAQFSPGCTQHIHIEDGRRA